MALFNDQYPDRKKPNATVTGSMPAVLPEAGEMDRIAGGLDLEGAKRFVNEKRWVPTAYFYSMVAEIESLRAASVSATPPPTGAPVSYSKIPNNSQAPAPEIEGVRSAMLKIQSAPAITEIKKGHTYYCRNGLKWGTPITDGRRENTERIWDLVLEIPGIEVDIHPHPREQPAAPDTQEARQAAIMRVYEAAMDWADTSPVDKDFDAVCEALWNAVEESQGGQPAAQEGEP